MREISHVSMIICTYVCDGVLVDNCKNAFVYYYRVQSAINCNQF